MVNWCRFWDHIVSDNLRSIIYTYTYIKREKKERDIYIYILLLFIFRLEVNALFMRDSLVIYPCTNMEFPRKSISHRFNIDSPMRKWSTVFIYIYIYSTYVYLYTIFLFVRFLFGWLDRHKAPCCFLHMGDLYQFPISG